jgi:hypothetical protein
MQQTLVIRTAIALTGAAGIVLLGLGVTLPGHAQQRQWSDARSGLGLAVAPVPLNLEGKNQASVGLGSYLVNVVAGCNDCHTSASVAEYAMGSNPFFGQPKKINPANYLGGGRDFGALVPNSPDIVSRNLTPDKSGLPIGGETFSQFFQIMETGVDMDKVHPSCSPVLTANCIPPPFDGTLLQIMPWPAFQNLSIEDLKAIYDYLSAIPCVEGGPGEPAERCK